MKKLLNDATFKIIAGFILFLIPSCVLKESQASLVPPDKRPVSSILVEDATEAALLEQQLKLEIVKMQGTKLYFYDKNTKLADKLKELGYEQIIKEELQQVYKRYLMLALPGTTDTIYKDLLATLTRQRVQVINREKNHWVIYGTLAALNNLKKSGYILNNLNYEIRPREVEIYVKAVEDVQRISESGVDIFSTERIKSDSTIIIHGAAFDHQIDNARTIGYKVTVKKSSL